MDLLVGIWAACPVGLATATQQPPHIALVRTQHAPVTGTSAYARKSWGGHLRCDLAPLTTSFRTVGQWERQHLAMAGSRHLHSPTQRHRALCRTCQLPQSLGCADTSSPQRLCRLAQRGYVRLRGMERHWDSSRAYALFSFSAHQWNYVLVHCCWSHLLRLIKKILMG